LKDWGESYSVVFHTRDKGTSRSSVVAVQPGASKAPKKQSRVLCGFSPAPPLPYLSPRRETRRIPNVTLACPFRPSGWLWQWLSREMQDLAIYGIYTIRFARCFYSGQRAETAGYHHRTTAAWFPKMVVCVYVCRGCSPSSPPASEGWLVIRFVTRKGQYPPCVPYP
ncbi:hypothetical protein CCUS01_16614, partial [Colletotrichum cuscutae]